MRRDKKRHHIDINVHGWPEDRSIISEPLRPYWSYRDELSVQNGIIYKGTQAMVPQSMHKEMLRKIHANHFGAESNIRMACEVLFWPGMRKSIQDMCDACGTCAQYGTTAPNEPMRSLPIPTRPKQIVSQDICELENRNYLVTVRHFSDWIEVDPLGDTLSSTVIDKTKAHFARYGVPAICQTDNGPQFISKQYRTFSVAYGFKHTTSSSFHPKGNRRAEAAVKVAKSMLKKADDFHSALLLYRNTPPRGHTYSPAQRMFLHRTRTLLPTTDHLLALTMINFDIVKEDILKKRHASKTYYDKSAGVEHKPSCPSWELRMCQTTTPSSWKTLDLWGSDQDGQRQVLHCSYLSWYPDSKEQSPNETCSSTTNVSPTPGSPQPSHSGYDSLPNTCAKSVKTNRGPSPERTADPRAIKHNCRSHTRTHP